MSRLPLLTLAVLFVCAGSGAALANCTEYGATAAAQQSENKSLGCGFSGLRWHSNAVSHAAFCSLVGEGAVSGETAIREAELAGCRPASVAEDDNTQARECQRSEIAEGAGTSNQRAKNAAHSLLGRQRAEMVNSGLTQCLYQALGCTGSDTGSTCWMSVECCSR